MTQFGTVEPTTQGDQYKPQDNYGHMIVVRPKGIRSGIPAKNPKPGKEFIDGLICDLLDLDGTPAPRKDDESGKDGRIFIDAILFGGSFVDSMKGKMGELIVVTIGKKIAAGGNPYAIPVPAEDTKRAGDYWAANGDPFVKFGTTDPLS